MDASLLARVSLSLPGDEDRSADIYPGSVLRRFSGCASVLHEIRVPRWPIHPTGPETLLSNCPLDGDAYAVLPVLPPMFSGRRHS